MSKILKNVDAKVVRSVGGNVLRENFQFSKGFYNGDLVNAYLRMPHFANVISRSSEWTMLGWVNHNNSLSGNLCYPVLAIVNANASGAGVSLAAAILNNSTLEHVKSETASLFGSGPSGFIVRAGGSPGRNFVGFHYNGIDELRYYLNSSVSQQAYSNVAWAYDFTNVYIAVYNRFGTVSYPIICDEYVVFNRALSAQEASYIYNAKTGNDPASIEGLKGWYKMELAEILDFSIAQDGSDLRAGIRDRSDNFNHLDFINVPAGTNQERVDYINTNLLKPW